MAVCFLPPPGRTGRKELLTVAVLAKRDATLRPMVSIDSERCAGCSECVKECPTGCLALGRHNLAVVRDAGACVGCQQCQRTCPYRCITVKGPFLGLDDRAPDNLLPLPERLHGFAEVRRGFTPAEAVGEASRCLLCPRPRCRDAGCPAKNDIPAMIAAIRQQDFLEALRVLAKTSNLHAVCSRVCDQASLCEGACVYQREGGQAVAIGQLERFVGDWARGKGYVRTEAAVAATGYRVAVVGSGPAGLSAAEDLTRRGHAVTVYETLPVAGGVMAWGISEFVLPLQLVEAKVAELRSLGVQFRLGVRIGRDCPIERLFQEGADVVFLSAGAEKDVVLDLPGKNLPGITTATDFLAAAKLAPAYPQAYTMPVVGHNVLVVGMNNIALHVARGARRLGAGNVTVVDPIAKKRALVSPGELETAVTEGITLVFGVVVKAFVGRDKVEAAELGENRRGWWEKLGFRLSQRGMFTVPADTVVFARGYRISQDVLELVGNAGIETDAYGTVVVMEDNGRTNREKVWAAGDVVTGPKSVVGAMAAGKKAARHIDQVLRWRHLFAHEGGGSPPVLRSLRGGRKSPKLPVRPFREEP